MTTRDQLASVAQSMLDGRIELQGGCREICRLRHELSGPDVYDKDILVLVGIDSELDDCPIGPARAHWAPAFLAEKDQQRDDYLRRERDRLFNACSVLASWR
ncbi:MAG: hypothetical protein ABIY55_01865 [Kofleriaceae bacterium]